MNEHLFSLAGRVRRFMAAPNPEAFENLAIDLYGAQRGFNAPYAKFSAAAANISSWKDIPAVPTVAFKELELTCLAPSSRTHVFYSSGTTQGDRSRHFHSRPSLELYEESLLACFDSNFGSRMGGSQLLSLAPAAEHASNSSLAHMFSTIVAHNPGGSDFVGVVDSDGAWNIDMDRAVSILQTVPHDGRRLAIFGTAFLFVHLLEELERRNLTISLPKGSWIIETGGYKGRSREVPKEELRTMITNRLGIASSEIFSEYGMSELSSQAYDRGDGVFHFPPWARVRIISPATGQEVADGERGLIRVYDLANVWSVMAVQTEDIGIKMGGGFQLCGRAAQAEARGCSLMAA